MTANNSSNQAPRSGLDWENVSDYLQQNIRGVITLLALVIVGIVGWTVYDNHAKSVRQEEREVLYQFEVKAKDYLDKEPLKLEEIKKLWTEANGRVSANSPELAMSAFRLASQLNEKNQAAYALEIVSLNEKNFAKVSPELSYLAASLKAVLMEDLGKTDEAISTLEELLKSKSVLLEAKIYFDLGRLYKKKGDKEKAKQNFTYIIEHFAASSYVSYAKVYLREL